MKAKKSKAKTSEKENKRWTKSSALNAETSYLRLERIPPSEVIEAALMLWGREQKSNNPAAIVAYRLAQDALFLTSPAMFRDFIDQVSKETDVPFDKREYERICRAFNYQFRGKQKKQPHIMRDRMDYKEAEANFAAGKFKSRNEAYLRVAAARYPDEKPKSVVKRLLDQKRRDQ